MIFILGPCVIESRDHCRNLAMEIKAIADHFGIDWYFKASYDKANRTSLNGFRGIGERAGFDVLDEIRKCHGIRTTTDVHSVEEVFTFAPVVDMIQIPALLSRQTDLLVAAGQAAECVNIKKGQFTAPEDMIYAVEKVQSGGQCRTIYVTERGTSFGYHRLVVDFLGIPTMQAKGMSVIFDCTHSLQHPQAGSGCSASAPRDYARIFARAATAAGVQGIFAEVHDDPDHAKCDGPNSLDLKQLPNFIEDILKLKNYLNFTA